jgi:hypothetical protein
VPGDPIRAKVVDALVRFVYNGGVDIVILALSIVPGGAVSGQDPSRADHTLVSVVPSLSILLTA